MSDVGRAMRGRAQGRKAEALGLLLEELDPAMLEWSDDFIFDSVWGRPGMTFEQRMLVAITALGTSGQIAQLRNYFHGALQAGIPAETIHEGLLMLSVYAGFPAALNALTCFKEVLVIEARADG